MPDPGASRTHTRIGRLALIATTLLWGSSFTIMKDALTTVPTLWLLATRFSGAAMLMVLIGRQYYAADYAAYEKLING